jgi:hypothetical protein
LLFFPGEKFAGLSVTVMKTSTSPENPKDVLAYGSFDFQGAYVYHVKCPGIYLKGTHQSSDSRRLPESGDYWGWAPPKNIHRILYIGDHIYTISPAMIQANRMSDLSVTGSVSLNK